MGGVSRRQVHRELDTFIAMLGGDGDTYTSLMAQLPSPVRARIADFCADYRPAGSKLGPEFVYALVSLVHNAYTAGQHPSPNPPH